MYLKEIILDGFKCYEKRTIIPDLHESFNAITGMNGAGKSNIIDGIIFVLGIDTNKLLRVSSIKEVINIHRKECKVTLIFNNYEKSLSPVGYVNYDVLNIMRCVDEEGKSKYFLNGHPCTNSTISKLFSSTGLGIMKGSSYPHFVVMQGHITKILSMKSNDLYNLIQETAGTRFYESEKEKSLVILQKKEKKLKEASESLFRRISPFFVQLKEERQAYLEQKNMEMKKKQNIEREILLQKEIESNEYSKVALEILENLKNYKFNKNELKEIENKLEEVRNLENDDNFLKIQKELEIEKLKLEKLNAFNDSDEYEKKEQELQYLNSFVDNIDEMKEKERYLMEELKNQENNFLGIKSICSNKVDRVEEISRLKIEMNRLEIFLKNNQGLNDFSIDDIQNKIKEIEEYYVSDEEINNLQNKINEFKSKIAYPIIEGVFGILEENFSIIDKKYEEAIYSSMGSRSKFLVVKNEKIGNELLSSNNSSISIIPLNKIKPKIVPGDILRNVRQLGGIPITELINFDEEVSKAMEFVFNGYFLFENKENARKACYDYKVIGVTLDGTLYDPKGTLCGGKIICKNIIFRRKDLLELEQNFKEKKENKRIYEKEKYNLNELKSKICNLREIKKAKNDIQIIENSIKFLNKLIESKVDYSSELSSLRQNIVKKIREKEEFLRRKNVLETEIFELKNKIKSKKEDEKNILKKILQLEGFRRQSEIKISKKSIGEREEESLELKRKHLVQNILKSKSKISKLRELLKEFKSGKNENSKSHLPVQFQEISDVLDDFKLSSNIFNVDLKIFDVKKEDELKKELFSVRKEIEMSKNIKKFRMDPRNFDLLEKNDEIIKELQEKIKKLENDKMRINKSINQLHELSIKEIERAFNHINNKIGTFINFFIKDADARIIKNEDEYLLKVKMGNWKDSLVELSGGQRSLMALSLIFSMLTYKTAPFYIFDEVDSALDLSHTQAIGEIIKKEFKNSQFIAISLKDGMYSNANNIYRVFVDDGYSQIGILKHYKTL
ncbi:structural maintenance of chromosomes protein [Hamiltosporidium magnivora]|uniref:Structural maintenance of chromosomes protein n=1 Tax=Hamiltosporidium magnivora TaxID=148818 RepID=A0A4Q9LM77_9MICR|nr:structural maintenance of chromosomes protein [Hamiltosporidium magnivora]